MRVGILALLHESNTFVRETTEWERFEEDVLLSGEAIRDEFASSAHEIGGFLRTLDAAGAEAVPVFAARAYPGGTIAAGTFERLVERLLAELRAAGPLDGVLAAPHGATVADDHPDADGWWLSRVRREIGPGTPFVATIDPHANLSPLMVESTDALVAYATNPHVDQFETGRRAAELMLRTLGGEVRPVQAAAFPPLAIDLPSQQTSEPPLCEFLESMGERVRETGALSASLVLGFPCADVEEMGSSVVAVTDADRAGAASLAGELAGTLWEIRSQFEPALLSPADAVADAETSGDRVVLLDMGDNVGGGSPGDGTVLLGLLHERRAADALVVVCDPGSVADCEAAGIGRTVGLEVGGKSDDLHGAPVPLRATVRSLHEGAFRETGVRHGGFTTFHQGRSAVVDTDGGLTVLLHERRVPPFSIAQLTSCGLRPERFRVMTAKGVIAPRAAYGDYCDRFLAVNTPGSTCVEMRRLPFRRRRRPMFPFEPDTEWDG